MTVSDRGGIVCCDANLAVTHATYPAAVEVHNLWRAWHENGVRIVAPSLFRYEVTNAIHRTALYVNASNEQAAEILDFALSLPVHIEDVPRQHERALALSRRFGLPAAYDAHYLALSEALGCPFFTSDSKLVNAVSHAFDWVHLVTS